MFYIYNETSKQLELNVKTDKFFHLGIKDMKFGVDIMTSSTEEIDKEYNTTIFESLESVQILSCHSYNLIYNNKSGNPFLRIDEEPSDNSYDAYLLVYKYNEEENGMKLFNEKRINFNVLYSKHDEENQIIYIIGVAKPTLNPKFFLTFFNGSTYNTKHLMFNRKFISLVYNKYYTEEEAKANKFANVIMTPSKYQMLIPDKSRKPFSIIVAPWNNPEKKPYLENILKAYRMNEKFVKCIDSEAKAIYRELQQLRNVEHYNALTVFIDKSFDEFKKEAEPTFKYLKMFKNVNYLTNDKKIVYKH